MAAIHVSSSVVDNEIHVTECSFYSTPPRKSSVVLGGLFLIATRMVNITGHPPYLVTDLIRKVGRKWVGITPGIVLDKRTNWN